MSLGKYDEALLEKLKSVFPNVENSDDIKAFENSIDDKAKVKLPLISFWRINDSFDLEGPSNYSYVRRGKHHYDKGDDAHLFKSFPIDLQYQIDIWAVKRIQVDDIYRELLMFFLEDPILILNLEGFDKPEEFAFKIIDTSSTADTDSFSDKGRIYQKSIVIQVIEARMFFEKNVKLIKDIPIELVSLKEEDLYDKNRE